MAPPVRARVHDKQPGDDRLYDFDLSDVLREGDTITSIGAPQQTKAGLVAGSEDLALSGQTFSGQVAQLRIAGGTDGENYKVTVTVTTAGGDTVEADGWLHVRDA